MSGSYQVEVVDLAQVDKEVSQGYADKTAPNFATGNLSLTVGSASPVDIAIDSTNNSLEGVMNAINGADAGVTASIINDGTNAPYRLVLTGSDPSAAVSLTSSQPDFNGDIAASLSAGGYADQNAQLFGGGTITLSTGDVITLGGTNNSLTDIATAINDQQATTGVGASVDSDGNGG